MFVHPHQVAEILKRHPAVRKGRLVVDRDKDNDTMTLRCEIEGEQRGLDQAIAESIQAVTKMRGAVEFVPSGSLPNDGKVIDDVRKY
jgi:phenylacetate-CoA ligase